MTSVIRGRQGARCRDRAVFGQVVICFARVEAPGCVASPSRGVTGAWSQGTLASRNGRAEALDRPGVSGYKPAFLGADA